MENKVEVSVGSRIKVVCMESSYHGLTGRVLEFVTSYLVKIQADDEENYVFSVSLEDIQVII